MKSKTHLKNTFPPPFSSSQALPPPPGRPRETGNEGYGHFITCGFSCCSKERMPSPAPTWSPSHGWQFSMNFSNLSASHGQQFSINCSNVDSLPQGTAVQAEPAPVWVPHSVTSPTMKLALAWAPLYKCPCHNPAPARASYGFTASSLTGTCSSMRILHRLQVDLHIPMLLHGYSSSKGNPSPSTWSTSSHSSTCCLPKNIFFFFLNYVVTKTLLSFLMGSALVRSRLALALPDMGGIIPSSTNFFQKPCL